MNSYMALLLGVVLAGVGGELFVRGTVGLARAARISPGIIAATVAAFATSSPELVVAVTSAMAGSAEISLGNILGANIVNVALILGAALLIAPITVRRGSIRRDFPVALLAPVALGLMLIDGELSARDAVLLLAGFLAWLVAITAEARRERSAAAEILGETNTRRAVFEGVVGVAMLLAAGKLIVDGGTDIARTFGLSEFVIGATIVAIGTTMPELVTALIARLRGHDEVGVGTVLGSNIFNGLFIAGVASAITPVQLSLREAGTALLLGFVAVALTYPPRSGLIDRWRGGLLLAVFALHSMLVLQS
jgi:cation:H+ antiporter